MAPDEKKKPATEADPVADELEQMKADLAQLKEDMNRRAGEKADWEHYEEAYRVAERARTEVEILSGKIARTHLSGSVPLGWEVAGGGVPVRQVPVPYPVPYYGPGGSGFAMCNGPGGSGFAMCNGPGGSGFAMCNGPGGSGFAMCNGPGGSGFAMCNGPGGSGFAMCNGPGGSGFAMCNTW